MALATIQGLNEFVAEEITQKIAQIVALEAHLVALNVTILGCVFILRKV